MAVKIIVFMLAWLTAEAKWTHHLVLDQQEFFHLFWTPSEETIRFEIQVKTHGYVAIGFSPNGGMSGSDIILGWISDLGIPQLYDMKAFGNKSPVLDENQDVILIQGYQNESYTVLTFERKWSTCDPDDTTLGSDTTRLIWSYSENDPSSLENLNRNQGFVGSLIYHGSDRRGVRSVYLQEMPQESLPTEDLLTWDLTSEVELPNDDHTHYWCRIFKAPQIEEKHHMVALRPLIQKGNEAYVHHMVLYECHVSDSKTWFENHVGSSGAACYSPNMPPEWTFCLATNAWAWAVGSEGETLPDHAGMPLGEKYGGADYFMLETHYDNPDVHQNIIDSSGLQIFYTRNLRQYDTAMLLLGSEVNFLHMIPPQQEMYKTIGRCTSECTQNSIPENGIQILSGVLHSHLSGRQIRLRHIRQGQELPIILEDNNYDFNFQASRQPLEDRGKVLPGDELILECEYSTKSRDKPTFGGLSTREEMCLGFILYYPRSALADCRSLPTLETTMEAFGIQKVQGQAFDKLRAFMEDLGSFQGGPENDTLQELLTVLMQESRKSERPSSSPILSEEDLLNKPFYTVEEPPIEEIINDQQSDPYQFLPSLVESQSENYRELLPQLLLSLKIQEPLQLQNISIGQLLATTEWKNQAVRQHVQDAFVYGSHNSLCLAHGRKPIQEYVSYEFPQFTSLAPNEDIQCAINSPRSSSTSTTFNFTVFLATIFHSIFH